MQEIPLVNLTNHNNNKGIKKCQIHPHYGTTTVTVTGHMTSSSDPVVEENDMQKDALRTISYKRSVH